MSTYRLKLFNFFNLTWARQLVDRGFGSPFSAWDFSEALLRTLYLINLLSLNWSVLKLYVDRYTQLGNNYICDKYIWRKLNRRKLKLREFTYTPVYLGFSHFTFSALDSTGFEHLQPTNTERKTSSGKSNKWFTHRVVRAILQRRRPRV